jgi:capsular polysaccharide biosynthesis protein
VTIAIAALLGLFVGAAAIYLLALVSKVAQGADEIASAFGAPVLARVPRTT